MSCTCCLTDQPWLVVQVVTANMVLLLLLLARGALQGDGDPSEGLVAHELVREQHKEASLKEQLQGTCTTPGANQQQDASHPPTRSLEVLRTLAIASLKDSSCAFGLPVNYFALQAS
jgi:hypothetical protein